MNIENYLGPERLPPINHTKLDKLSRTYNYHYISDFFSLQEGLQKTLFWSLELMSLAKEYSLAKGIRGFKYMAFGFLDSKTERDEEFGITIFTENDLRKEKANSFYEFQDFSFYGGNDFRFPIVIQSIRENTHSTSHPTGGTGACFAKSRVSTRNPNGPGILTAKHVVGSILGASVNLSCGCKGTVTDIAPEGIDAALVECSCAVPHIKKIAPVKLIAPWMDFEFDGNSSGTITGKVTKIMDTNGILDSPHLPSRLFLDRYGSGGDSGALVKDLNSDEPLGIYLGSYTDPSGNSGGIAQHAYQVTEIMDMELYK